MSFGAAERLEALNRLTLAISATLEYGQIFAALWQHARELVEYDRISFSLLERKQAGRLRVYAAPWGDGGPPGGESMAVPVRGTLAEVVRTRQPVIRQEIDEASLDPEDATDRAVVQLGVRSLVSLPLLAQGELVGALTFSSRLPGRYQAEDLPICTQIAAQLAQALRRAELFADERRRAEQMRLLNEVATCVVSALSRDEMLSQVVELAHRVFDIVHLAAFALEPVKEGQPAPAVPEMKLVAVAGRWAQAIGVGWSQPIDRGVIGRAVREARPVLVSDTAADPDYVPYPGIDSRTELVVPVRARGAVLGALNAESHLVNAFDAEDVRTLTTIAEILAAGLERLANAEVARQKEVLARENASLRAQVARRGGELIGQSPRFLGVLQMIDKIAPSDAAVLVQGESGTGKELVAARLHRLSRRAGGPYVVVNAGAFPETLLESELFGHEAGAFTGATHRKPGLVEAAEGGTLFLDEIGEVPLPLQAKLLRFLQGGEYYRLGGQKALHADVRIVTATNRDLEKEVAAGRFREDLWFRINTITVELPPLRERAEDIPALARHFLARVRGGRRLEISDLLMTALVHYPWPGNVRELANVIERLAILGEEGELGLEFVPSHIVAAAARAPDAPARSTVPRLRDVEREHILRVLAKNGGDKTRTAKELGIALKTLYNKLSKYKERERKA